MSQIGYGLSDPLGFYGATPVTRPTSASQAAVVVSATSTTTQLRVDLNKVAVLANIVRANLVSLGLIKGS